MHDGFEHMRNVTICLTILSCLAFLGQGCDHLPSPTTKNDQVSPSLIHQLAHGISPIAGDSLFTILSSFPHHIQDSFFLKRFTVLESQEADDAIKETLLIYQKLQPESALYQGFACYFEGIFQQYAGHFIIADSLYQQAVIGFERQNNVLRLALALDKYSGSLITQGKTDDALPLKFRAIELLKHPKYKEAQMLIKLHLANAFNLKGDSEQAMLWLKEPESYYEAQKDTMQMAYIAGLEGSIAASRKDYTQALTYHKLALDLRMKIKDQSGLTESYYHVGRMLGKLEQWQASLDTFNQAFQILQKNTDKQGKSFIETGIGEALFHLGRFDEAESYLLSSLERSINRKQFPAAAMGARRMSEVRKHQHRFEEALQYQEQLMAFKDTLINQEKLKIGQELSIKYQIHEKELNIAALKREHRLSLQRNGLAALTIFVGLCTLFYIYRNRTKQETKKLADENARAEAQAIDLAQALEFQKSQLDAHRNQLDEYARMLIEKNRQLVELSLHQPSDQLSANSVGHDELYSQVILTDSDWERFQGYFNKVYPGFISALRQRLPDITPAEIRLVLLDKLGLSQKETSAILGISVDAVKKGRYRLKKKYNLDADNLSGLLGDTI